ncbi:MAG: ATP-dependent sacrificial sulfur transferase LarE [Acidimicrobiia bacterium]|nr:ATP-dependent sacrificial sulfur transferase LarE [Acidimicrobiia bacterium]
MVIELRDRLELRIAELGSVVVAFSGGVDSSVVAALAHRALGSRAVAVTAHSPALASGELDGARRVAAAIGVAHEVISTAELERDGYRANGSDRCYHCKTELYSQLAELARDRVYGALLSGANTDDIGEWRPGLTAAAEHAVVHPLVDLDVGKSQVRELARSLGLPSADKPASPCLASRIPHGTIVDAATLARIDRAEAALKARGYASLRVRHYGNVARVEVSEAELPRVLDPTEAQAVKAAVGAAGYGTVEISTEPLRSGSLTVQFLGRRT